MSDDRAGTEPGSRASAGSRSLAGAPGDDRAGRSPAYPLWLRRAAEAITFAAVIAAIGVVGPIVVAIVIYGPALPAIVLAKWGTYFVAVGVLGYAAFVLRPQPHERITNQQRSRSEREKLYAASESHFSAFVMRVPPARFVDLPPDERIETGWKAALASAFLFVTAFAMDALLGINMRGVVAVVF